MGCGKSKHDVISENTTIPQRKKSSVTFKEIETKTEDIQNNNVENASSVVEVEQKERVKENHVEENKDNDEVNDVKDEEKIDGEEKKEEDVVEGPSDEVKKNDDVALTENDEKINDVVDASGNKEEKNLVEENGKEEASVKEESLTKKEEVVEDTNVSRAKAESNEWDLKFEDKKEFIYQQICEDIIYKNVDNGN